jgi:FtsX-like permease family
MARGGMRRLRLPMALRRMRVQRAVLAAVMATVALTAAVAAGLVAYSRAGTTAAVRGTIAGDAAQASILFSGGAAQEPLGQATASVQTRIDAALGGIRLTVYTTPELESLALPGSTAQAGRVATLLGAPALAAHARLVAGAWPPAESAAGAAAGSAVPIAVDQHAARVLGLAVGSTVRTTSTVNAHIAFTVVGVFAPDDPKDPYWYLDPLGGTGKQTATNFTTFGPFFTDPSYLAQGSTDYGGALAAEQTEWEVVPQAAAFGVTGLGTDGSRLSSALAAVSADPELGAPQVSTGLPALLGSLSSAALVAQSLVYAELLELLVVSLAALFIVVRTLTEARESEAALLWARGGTGGQLLRLRTVESLLLAVPAVIVAPFAARPLAERIGQVGTGGSGGVAVAALGGGEQGAIWIAIAAVAVLAIGVVLAPTFSSAVSPLAMRSRRGRQNAVTAVGRTGFDLVLLALAVVACWQLLQNDSIVGLDQSGDAAYSPIAIAAPALALAAGAVLLLRLLPLAARLGDRLARRGRGLALPLAFWQTGRRPLKLAGPVLLTMLAVAAGALSLSEYTSGQRSTSDQAAFTAGSDLDVTFPAGLLTSAELARIGASPGVSAVSPFSRILFSPPDVPGARLTLLALDPASAARTVLLRPDLSAVPLSTLMSDLTGPPDARGDLPAVVTQAFAATTGIQLGGVVSIPVGSSILGVHVVAIVQQFPTVSTTAPSAGGVLVDRASMLASPRLAGTDAAALAPGELWIRGSNPAPAGLPPGSVTTSRTALLASMRDAPLTEEPLQALLAVALATVLLALCGMVVGVVSGGAERAGELALLDALGLSRRGRIGLLCLEQALLAVPGALAGIALGVFISRVVVPVATLTADAGRPQPPVTVLTPWTAILLGSVCVVAVPVLTGALAGTRRRNTAAVLREGADQ